MAGLSTGAGAPVVKLYHEKSMIFPDVSRVLACLYEKNIQFETEKDSYKDILKLQASRSVPVPFYDGPTFLQAESRAICRYIAETYEQRGYPFLLGKDVLERASIEQWLRHEEHAFDPPSRALFCHLAFPVHDDDDDDINKEKRKLEEVLEVYEQRLGESEFLAGNKFTLADLVHLPNTHHILTSEQFAYLYDSRKNVQRWWNTISARHSWQQVLRDMNSVEEEYQMELEEQEEQWQTDPPQTSVSHTIRLDPRMTTGTESRTILVPPPSAGTISTSFKTVPQGEQPLPPETTYHDRPSPRKESNFFTTTEKTPSTPRPRPSTNQKTPSGNFVTTATPKTSQRTDTDISSYKDASSQTKPSQISSKEASAKPHLSDFFKASSHPDEAATPTRPSPPESSKTYNKIAERRETSEAVGPSSPRSTKVPHEIDERASVDPRFDKPAPYTKPTTNIPQTSYGRPTTQRDLDTYPANEADEIPYDLGGGVQPPYARGRAEQTKITSADQRAATRLPEHVSSKDVQGETAQPAQPRGSQEVTKDARQADQKRVTAAPSRQQPSGEQNVHKKFIAPLTLKVPDLSTMQPESQEDTHNITSEDGRFSTKRLRKMMEDSEKAAQAGKSQPTDFQPSKEETPYIYKKPSDVQDRTILDDRKTGSSPSTGTRAPDFPTSAAEGRVVSPTKEVPHDDRSATEPQKSPSINEQEKLPVVPSQAQPTRSGQASKTSKEASPDDGLAELSTINQWRQASPPPLVKQEAPEAPNYDELAKTAGIDKRAPPSTPKQTMRDERNALATGQGTARGIGNVQSDKNSIMDERAPQMTPRQSAPSGTQRASESTQGGINNARDTSDDMFGKTSSADESNRTAIPKQTILQGEIPAVRGTSDDDRDMKLAADEKAATNKQKPASSSHQTIGPIKGTTPTSYGTTGDDLAKTSRADERPTPSSKVQEPAFDRQSASTTLQRGIPDAREEKKADRPSVTTPRRQEPTPDTQLRRTADQVSSQASLSSYFTGARNKENDISEAGQTKDSGPQATRPSVMNSQKNMNEAYNDRPSTQQMPNDQYRSQPAETKKKQGADAAVINEIGKPKKDDMWENPNQSSTGRVQRMSTEDASKLQLQSDLNNSISSKDSSAKTREMLPSVPDKSTGAQQMQGDKSSISQEDIVKQGSESGLQESVTEQPKKGNLANADEKIRGGEAPQKSEERTFSNTEQMKSNKNNRKSDGSTRPASFDDNEGNLPESQRRGSSGNP
uniref:glutathione transferase n=1 Tax=Leersia perrieri TaxID=77586 RepID=A0A0D9XAL6_9ORYZ